MKPDATAQKLTSNSTSWAKCPDDKTQWPVEGNKSCWRIWKTEILLDFKNIWRSFPGAATLKICSRLQIVHLAKTRAAWAKRDIIKMKTEYIYLCESLKGGKCNLQFRKYLRSFRDKKHRSVNFALASSMVFSNTFSVQLRSQTTDLLLYQTLKFLQTRRLLETVTQAKASLPKRWKYFRRMYFSFTTTENTITKTTKVIRRQKQIECKQ